MEIKQGKPFYPANEKWKITIAREKLQEYLQQKA